MTSTPVGAAAPPVVAGQVLAGKFRIERVIGEGGMGIVAEATHLGLDERVALKFLRREVMSMPDVVARFDREARAVVKLKSEHVARVSDVGKTEDGIPYMVMELLSGKDFAQMLTPRPNVVVWDDESAAFAMPKSTSLASPAYVMMMLWGETSRWTTLSGVPS